MAKIIPFPIDHIYSPYPYFMDSILQAQRQANQQRISFHPSWKSETVCQEAKELLRLLEQSADYRFTPMRIECCSILQESQFLIPSDLWIKAAQLLLCRYLPLSETEQKYKKSKMKGVHTMSYTWNLPTKVLFGAGRINDLGKEKMPGKKALLLISNGKSVRTNGSLEAVEQALTQAGVEYVIFDKIQSNPLEPTLMEGVQAVRENGCDFIVGLGGGSVLDAATIISAIAPQKEGRVWDYVQGGTGGGRPLTEKPLPYIEITTSAGTGSEVDCWGVVTNPETHEKIGFQGGYADLAIVDPKLMLTVPSKFTAYQGFDALFHSVEGYLSKFCNEAAEMFELAAIQNIAQYLPRAVKDGSDLEARTKIAFANTMSGYSMEVCSCVSQHAMEHALSGYHQSLPHGAGLIMISHAYFSKWLEKHACDDRFIALAKAMGKADASKPEDFLTALEELKVACDVADLKMSDYGITPDEFSLMAKDARSTMGGLFFCDRAELTEEDVVNIYQKSYC